MNRRRGIYLLPNLFTTTALFAGFYSIVAAMNSQYQIAAIAIFVAMVFDGLDGRIARLTNTESEFGAQYDSLADVVSFGLAPALVAYVWALSTLGKLGWMAAFLYVAATALRLARFNTQVQNADKRYFQGLPSPAAAAVVAGMIWFAEDFHLSLTVDIHLLALPITVFVGLMMVSNVRYHSFKQFNLRNRVPFVAILLIPSIFIVIGMEPALFLFALSLFYALSGPVFTLIMVRRKRLQRSSSE